MIRKANTSDRRRIFQIWKECFGDRSEYINFFLDKGFSPERCLVWDIGGTAAAMLHLRYGTFVSKKQTGSFGAAYIYAAATLPQYRKQGIMARLIASAEKTAAKNGCGCTFLLPAGERLYGYYAKFGYKSLLHIKKAELSSEELRNISHDNLVLETPCQLGTESMRDRYFCPYLRWKSAELAYAIKEWRFTGGDIVGFDGGYSLCRRENKTVFIKELCGNIKDAAYMIADRYNAEKYVFLLAPYNDYPFKTSMIKYGMAKPLADTAAGYFENNRAYVNLMLD